MLYLYPSNKTENLAYLIAEIIERHPLTSPFKAETILIQSQGMGTWLQQELSDYSGVAALIDCKMPASFVWQLAQDLLPEQPHIPLFEKSNLRWELFRTIPAKLDEPNYRPLKSYLDAQSAVAATELQITEKTNQAKCITPAQQKTLFELSSVIADVFDAYQNYRPDWIEAWENGRSIVDGVSMKNDSTRPGLQALERWQADLWRAVYPDLALSERQHRSRLFAKLIDRLNEPKASLQNKLPERLFIFGLSALPPHWLSLMSALGKHLDIHFMVHNPCQYYWGDVLTPVQQLKLEQSLVAKGVSVSTAADTFLEGNPLLASWGKLGRDYLSLLISFSGIDEVPANLFDQENEASEPTALAWLQSDILNLQALDHVVKRSDESIRFASCHSHLREVEALHDYLFHLLSQHPELNPKDIIVMMPDVQDFSALIEAVFSRPAYDVHGRPQYLAYGISDQRLSMDQPLLETLAGLLSLSTSRITGAQVLDWLEMPAIRSRFSISESDMEDVKQWIKQLNIRWGLSETHRDKMLKVKGSGGGNTWFNASRRMLAGYLFGQEDIVSDEAQHVLAFPQRSPERQILAGKLMRFLDIIDSSIRLQTQMHTLEQWLVELSGLWQNWLDFELVAQDIQQVLGHFERALESEIACVKFDQTVSFQVIATILTAEFENQRVSQRFLAGRINFCTLMPMRSIPFKVVCMLGMNEGSYPRPVQRQSFDLLASTPARTGDRSRREDDRYLFLEALCSARSHLYISYCGRDIQDNSERFPSVLVSELQSYCAEHFSLADQTLVKDNGLANDKTILEYWITQHHLQPFNPAYFYGAAKHENEVQGHSKTFASEWLGLINSEQQNMKTLADDQGQLPNAHCPTTSAEQDYDIDLKAILSFASHPLRYYYNTVLQVYLRDVEEELLSSEPFSIHGLDAYSLKSELAESWFLTAHSAVADHEVSDIDLIRRWQLADKLPRPPLDQFYVERLSTSLFPMFAHIAQSINGDACVHSLELHVGKYRVSGHLLTLGNSLVELSLSKKPGASFFSFWVKHVFWSLYVQQAQTAGVDLKKCSSRFVGPENEMLLPLLTAGKAEDYALQLCEFFESATTSPYPFLPKTCYALLFESEAKAFTTFHGVQNIPAENLDPYWQRYCLLFDKLLPNTLLSNTQGNNRHEADWRRMPKLEASVFFQQIQLVKDSFEFHTLSANMPDKALKLNDEGAN